MPHQRFQQFDSSRELTFKEFFYLIKKVIFFTVVFWNLNYCDKIIKGVCFDVQYIMNACYYICFRKNLPLFYLIKKLFFLTALSWYLNFCDEIVVDVSFGVQYIMNASNYVSGRTYLSGRGKMPWYSLYM